MPRAEPPSRAAVIDDEGNIVARLKGAEMIKRMKAQGYIIPTENPKVFVQSERSATASAAPPKRLTPAERRHAERHSNGRRRK